MQTDPSLARHGPLESLQPQQSGPRLHIDVVVRSGAAAGSEVTVAIQAARGTRLGDIWTDLLTEADVEPGTASIRGDEVPADAVLGVPPLLHGAVLDVGFPFAPPESAESAGLSAAAVMELRVCSGPDAGAVRALPAGSYRVGREGCDVVIEDAEISRTHALIRVDTEPGRPVSVQDAGSTNGVMIGHCPLGASQTAPVHPDEPLRIGMSTLRAGPAERDPVVRRCDGSGTVQVNRPPRSRPPAPRAVVTMPSPPATRAPSRPPMAALAVPLLVGVGLAIATGAAAYLLFVILSPLMLLSSWLGDRITARRERRSGRSAYAREVARAELEVAAALRHEHRWRHAAHPDLAELLLAARGHRAGLWRRQPADEEFLALRIGLGTATARLEVRTDSPGDTESRQVTDVPVIVSLPSTGVLGVAGPSLLRTRLTRALVAQVAGLHSPRDVGLVVLADDPGWSWTSWLPHVRPPSGGQLSSARVAATVGEVQVLVDELVAELDRHADAQMTGSRRTVVLALGGSTLRAAAGGARLLAEGPAAGIYVICCDATVSALPIECTATVEIVDAASTRVRVDRDDGTSTHGVVLDGVSLSWAVEFARTLAPLRDPAPDGRHDGLPTDVRLLDLLEVDACDPWSLVAAWTARRRSTQVPIGVGTGGDAVVVDVAADGPHVLVAGTTGSGKSELLQTLVAALAAVNRPDELVFVLVDYKGGAAFRECALLPHSVGLVTDLDGHLTARALRSLDAELRRRERVLRDAGVPDIASYVRQAPDRARPGDVQLPRLVLVVDEFATLADELPDFVHGLVGIAQRGRSLGVHLVLATQRPAGVVSADIKANTSLRIALRVSDPAESVDVLDSSAAAALPRGTPGRAAIRFGGDPVRLVQVATVSGVRETHRQTEVWRTAVGTAGTRDAGGRPPKRESSDWDEVSDLARLVSAVGCASTDVGAAIIPSPWLPPLPTLVSVDDRGFAGVETSTRTGVPIGLQDLPAEQRRRALSYALDGGDHLLVVGSPGVGRTTTLRTVAGQLARHHTSADLHLHAIDPGGGLSWIAGLPQCGTVVGRHDPDRAARLLHVLGVELDRRQRILAAHGCGSIEEHRDRAPHPGLPIVVLLVDGWQAVRELLERVDDGQPVHQLERLLREGAAAGLRVVLSGDRDALSGRACAGIAERLLLPLRDPADYALAGVPRDEVPTASVAGRALAGRGWIETQVAVLGADGSGAAQRAALDRIGAAARERETGDACHGIAPVRLQSLPLSVGLTELMHGAADHDATDPGWTLVGVGGDAVVPVGLDLCPDRPSAVIAGPPGSGRTNALAVLARWCQARGRPVLLISDPRSPLHRLAGEPGILDVGGFDRAEPLSSALASHPGGVVLVDDADLLQGSAVEPALLSVLHRDRSGAGASLVLAGTTTDLAAAFRGVVAEARKGRTGLLLGPHSPVDGELLGIRVPRVRESLPGRGLLVQHGATTPVQVAAAGLS